MLFKAKNNTLFCVHFYFRYILLFIFRYFSLEPIKTASWLYLLYIIYYASYTCVGTYYYIVGLPCCIWVYIGIYIGAWWREAVLPTIAYKGVIIWSCFVVAHTYLLYSKVRFCKEIQFKYYITDRSNAQDHFSSVDRFRQCSLNLNFITF